MKITIELRQKDLKLLSDAMRKHLLAVTCGIAESHIMEMVCGLVLDAARRLEVKGGQEKPQTPKGGDAL